MVSILSLAAFQVWLVPKNRSTCSRVLWMFTTLAKLVAIFRSSQRNCASRTAGSRAAGSPLGRALGGGLTALVADVSLICTSPAMNPTRRAGTEKLPAVAGRERSGQL